MRAWLRGHVPLATSLLSGLVIAAVVTTTAIVSTGYTAQRLDLGDGSVWVANSAQQAIGRANTEVLELNTVVESSGGDLEVLQSGSTVLLFDRAGSTLDIVDPATSEIEDSAALPPDQPEVQLAGDRVAILERGTGELWLVELAELAAFDAESEPTLSLGIGGVASLAPDGLLFAVSPATDRLFRVDTAVSDAADQTATVDVDPDAELAITSVGGRWAMLDPDAGELLLDGATVDLSAAIGEGADPVLQWPSPDGDRVLVAHAGGLLAVPLTGGEPTPVAEDGGGAPARPLVLEGCGYAAWTDGTNWRDCAGDDASVRALDAMPGTALLSFAVNGDRAVLNDRRSGASWAVQRQGELIDNWDELIAVDEDQPEEQQNDPDLPPEVERVQQPPVAVDDAFGARPGRATVLPVLLNDFDPNGDVLVVDDLIPIDESVGRIDLINQRQQIQLTLAPGATGVLRFGYGITDGRGGAATAQVAVTIRGEGENGPPQQVRSTSAVVAASGRVTTQVLQDWVDPDGDPFYLASASAGEPDQVTYKPEGEVVFSDVEGGGDLAIVNLLVGDGSAEGTGSMTVEVRPPGDVPIEADPFAVQTTAGQEVTIEPLLHVRGGNGTVRLNSVPAKADVTITPSYEAGTFKFVSDAVRVHILEYVVTDGTQTVTGTVRVDVAAPPDANTTPITVPKTVFVQTLRNARIDVAATDVDPAGGVLLVTGITNLPAGSGVRAEILEQRVVRVSLERPLDDGPVVFNYRISNGLAEAEGVITVIEIPAPSSLQPPVAGDDSITARVGQAIDIPVLANDEHPDGRDLTLDPRLDQALPDGAGLLFASGDVLRYLAPDRPGNFTAAYRVTGPDGQAATGLVRIAVREADPATNNPPVPQPVTARVLAGETVRIRIPVSGIDPDGDTVQLLGQSANPQKGAVLELDGDTLVYQAGEYSAGTDTFTYTVIDSLGARATGTVRVGISPRLDGARNPVAIVDEVTVRPGVTVSVQVLANDSDPDGSPLRVVEATPNDEQTTAEIVGDLVQVTPPSEPGTYGVIYAIENDAGGTSQNFIRVTVDPEASPSYPVAEDSVLALSDIIDRDTVTVDVLAGVFFADGDPRSLGLSIHPGFGGDARVTSDRQVEVTIGNRSQIIPFKVTHPDDAEVFSYAFIRVPGTDDALPQLDRRAPALRVNSEDRLVIELAERVVSVGGDVRLTDSSSVEATHGNGDDLVVDQDTLVFTSADKYFGPASISFEVADEDGRTAVLVLPITVLPRENQPPVFGGAVIDFEPGQEKVIDLVRLTTYPYPDDLDELAYEVLTEPAGFTSSLRGTELTLRANPGTPKGSVATLSVGVRDDLAEGDPGRITLTVVPSTLPLVRPGADTAVAQRGGTTSVDVLANDEAGNPFPGEPLTVVDIRGLDGGALPAGVEIRPSADRSRLTVTVAPTAVPGDVGLQYQVADATGDAERMVWGSILVSVQDRPDPVQNLGPSGFADQRITMRWNAGLFNNSPITGYKVTTSKAGAVLAVTACPGTTCEIPTPGNGPANGVTVSVVATNAIGDSDPVTMAEPVWSDIIPPAPGGLSAEPLDRGLRLRWNEVSTPDGGSPVDRYRISVGGLTADVGPSACSGGVCFWDTTEAGLLDNGVEVSFTVSARNAALTALSVWNTSEPASGVPAGPPIAGAAPFATTLSDTVVALDWGGVFNPNGRPISAYTAAAFTGGAPRCNPDGGIDANGARLIGTGGGTGAQFTGLSANVTYSLVVFAYNGQGCTASATVTARTPPGVVTAIAPGGPVQNGDVYDFSLTGGSFADGSPLGGGYSVYYRLVGGSVPGTEHGPVPVGSLLSGDGLQYGQAVGVQVRACLDYDGGRMCQSEYSSVFPLGVPVDPRANGVRFERSGSVPLDAAGTFSWLAFPAGAYDSVEFACGTDPNGGAWQPAGDTLTCQVPPALAQTPYLHIRVTVGGRSYVKTYNGFQI